MSIADVVHRQTYRPTDQPAEGRGSKIIAADSAVILEEMVR